MGCGKLVDSGLVLAIEVAKNFIAAEDSENLIELADTKEVKEQKYQDLEK